MATGGKQLTKPNFQHGFSLTGGSATAASGAATCNYEFCVITTESLTTAAAAEYTLTLTNDKIDANSVVFVTVGKGTSTQGTAIAGGATPTTGSATIVITNVHASEAFNGTLVINVLVVNGA